MVSADVKYGELTHFVGACKLVFQLGKGPEPSTLPQPILRGVSNTRRTLALIATSTFDRGFQCKRTYAAVFAPIWRTGRRSREISRLSSLRLRFLPVGTQAGGERSFTLSNWKGRRDSNIQHSTSNFELRTAGKSESQTARSHVQLRGPRVESPKRQRSESMFV